MIFNDHSNLSGCHAFLGASKYHWIRYDEQKVVESYSRAMASARGTELHEFAAKCIGLNQRLPKSKKTLNLYVNDALKYKMIPEQVLYYSDICFGTADAISFRNNKLRIHDLKTGVMPGHMEQLEIYAALFCLEYSADPEEVYIELRIYQNDEILVYNPESDVISEIIDKIVNFNEIINGFISEEC